MTPKRRAEISEAVEIVRDLVCGKEENPTPPEPGHEWETTLEILRFEHEDELVGVSDAELVKLLEEYTRKVEKAIRKIK